MRDDMFERSCNAWFNEQDGDNNGYLDATEVEYVSELLYQEVLSAGAFDSLQVHMVDGTWYMVDGTW